MFWFQLQFLLEMFTAAKVGLLFDPATDKLHESCKLGF